MEKQPMETERVNNVEVLITGIKRMLRHNDDDVEIVYRIHFETEKGDITWKPKIFKSVFENGFQSIREVQSEVDELPEKLKAWANIVHKEGKIRALVSYTLGKGTQDGKEKDFRFIRSEKEFATWEVLAK